MINRLSHRNLTGLLILLAIFIMLMLVAARTSRRVQQKSLIAKKDIARSLKRPRKEFGA
jgi:hypothetical protein